jgi:hypothetical protein
MLSGEIVFMTEMAVLGKLVQVPEILQLKRVPAQEEAYHSRAEMLAYLGTSSRGAALRPQRLRVFMECVRGLRRLGLPRGERRELIADAIAVYVRQGYASVDFKESVETALGPERYTRLKAALPGAR